MLVRPTLFTTLLIRNTYHSQCPLLINTSVLFTHTFQLCRYFLIISPSKKSCILTMSPFSIHHMHTFKKCKLFEQEHFTNKLFLKAPTLYKFGSFRKQPIYCEIRTYLLYFEKFLKPLRTQTSSSFVLTFSEKFSAVYRKKNIASS